jgi:hypothetical protein
MNCRSSTPDERAGLDWHVSQIRQLIEEFRKTLAVAVTAADACTPIGLLPLSLKVDAQFHFPLRHPSGPRIYARGSVIHLFIFNTGRLEVTG